MEKSKLTTHFQGKIITVSEETITTPDNQTMQMEIVRHPGGAGVLAINDTQEVCIIRQFRPATGEWIWEIPAGRREANEDALTTAKRELQEEVGLVADNWQSLGAIWSTPGFCDEIIHLYLAQGLTETPTAREAHEYLQSHWWSWAKVLQQVHSAKINDAKTVASLFYAAPHLKS